MDKNDGMVKVDLSKAQLNATTIEHMKIMEKYNLARVQQMKKIRRKSNFLSVGLMSVAVGTYLYSMYAVRQEDFLDDFEEPKLKNN